jgi:hypothetical protein
MRTRVRRLLDQACAGPSGVAAQFLSRTSRAISVSPGNIVRAAALSSIDDLASMAPALDDRGVERGIAP